MSNTAVTREYNPYSTYVTVLLQGNLISGWVSAKAIKPMAITAITTPIILKVFLFIKTSPL